MKNTILSLGIAAAMSGSSVQAVTALLDFGGGATTGTAVANTNALGDSGGTLATVTDLTGAAISGLSIIGSGSGIGDGVHVNGPGANLTTGTVASNPAIGAVFSAYEHANTSSWGAENAGVANTYTISLNGLQAGTVYTVNVLGGRDGGIGFPAGAMSSTWTLASGTATLDTDASQFDFWDDSAAASSVIQETGSGPYNIASALAFNDAGMTTWEFTVGAGGADVDLNFVNPINSMLITAVPVPEPSSAALLGLGGLALILRRRV